MHILNHSCILAVDKGNRHEHDACNDRHNDPDPDGGHRQKNQLRTDGWSKGDDGGECEKPNAERRGSLRLYEEVRGTPGSVRYDLEGTGGAVHQRQWYQPGALRQYRLLRCRKGSVEVVSVGKHRSGFVVMEQVAILARVSTQGQDYKRQVVELTDYYQRMNWEVVKVFANKVSGVTRNADREEISGLVEYVKQHRLNRVVCLEISRLGRNTLEALKVINYLN